jgi:predicted AAA+ superfamily ATPase
MIHRKLQDALPYLSKGFPIITITGPRQSGKTTLVKMAYPDHTYIDLENLLNRRAAIEDPAALISDPKGSYILDEFQYTPQILSHLKVLVDNNHQDAQFILTGSNQFTLMRDVSQSLAGRTAIFELLPLTLDEAYPAKAENLDQAIHRGLYPRIVAAKTNPAVFYDSYIRTYLQRDVRLLTNVQNMEAFTRFLSLCAGRTGSILSKVSLANDTGVDAKTISNWLSLLQASYIIYLLPPWYGNVSKRLIKSPKLYFYDTGLACRLLRIRNAADLITHPLRGNLFETFMVSETMKYYFNAGIMPPLSYYRESNGSEIDLLIEKGSKLVPVEIKSAPIINSGFYGNLIRFGTMDLRLDKGRLIYTGDRTWENPNCRNVDWKHWPEELNLIDPVLQVE